MGRIEHTLLDGEFSVRPNRPKTFARNHTIPHKSYRCFYLLQRARTPWDPGPLATYAVAGRFPDRLDGGDVVRLHALLALGSLVGDLGALIEALEAVTRYARVVHEEVLATLVRGDEPVAFIVVEPLYRSLGHTWSPPFFTGAPPQQKSRSSRIEGGASLTIKPTS